MIILVAGLISLRESITKIIHPATPNYSVVTIVVIVVAMVEQYVASFPGVRGAYDLILDDFGPNTIIGSVHIEVADNMTARQIHELSHKISQGLLKEFGIVATVGIYAANTTGEFAAMRAQLQKLVEAQPKILQVHGFYGDAAQKTVYFDLVVDFKADANAIRGAVVAKLEEEYPDYTFEVILDTDYEG